VVAVAWWLAGRFLRPLRAITTAAQEISATNLHQRLALTGPNDELTELGRMLDNLFGRLEAAFESQRHFVANASHELRTPLAGQRTLLQVALGDPGATTADLRAACEEALHLGEHQERLIDALLTLATSERGVEHWESFDLAQLTGTVLAGRRHEAERRGIRIAATLVSAPATGDPTLVERLVANLIDNALRHNTTAGTVEISTISGPGRATITVSNTGPSISADQIERLLRPFQQAGSQPRPPHRRTRPRAGHGPTRRAGPQSQPRRTSQSRRRARNRGHLRGVKRLKGADPSRLCPSARYGAVGEPRRSTTPARSTDTGPSSLTTMTVAVGSSWL
jgi:signal transduction histidine kinase